ncbi:hypothetical protein U27_03682 [Candidatus Vecturithrix granuli]|uniref:TIR domain-containing protein n=1 Tax=Vecturithrix granuli TaxID=1499967 RepID=A0A081BWL4_VECG1|nr:hypothetical protein U27_03682 [Candidatus Vecturithrix granuli]
MIYTFYSYKGGVGRSMALVNIAHLMYNDGWKVLIVDWDLEAPGLERFLFSTKQIDNALAYRGIMNMLQDYKEKLLDFQPEEGTSFFPVYDIVEEYIVDITPNKNEDKDNQAKLSFLSAGQRKGKQFLEYSNEVKRFDWQDFYQNWEGEVYFEWLREQFNERFDVVLIDSRTGVTEMGGVCTYQLADVVVLFCAANEQNIDGTLHMVESFSDHRLPELRHNRELKTVIVPSRIERVSETEKLNVFRQKVKERFLDFLPEELFEVKDKNNKTDRRSFLEEIEIPYVPYYAFEEIIAVTQKDSYKKRSLELEKSYNGLFNALKKFLPQEQRKKKPQKEEFIGIPDHYQPRLTVYIVWHPHYEEGQRFANYLYSWLTRDVRNPVSRRIGIPLFFRNMSDAKSGAPLPIPFDDSHHTVVVALVDDHLVASDRWDAYLGTLWEKTQSPNSPHRLFPVSMSLYAFNLYSRVPEVNFIRVHDLGKERQPAALVRSLTHELCRLLLAQERTVVPSGTDVSFAPVKLFLSHAKRDGLDIAEHFRDYLYRKTALKSFFDANDIAPSYSFAEEIKAQIQDAAVLAIQTDAYASREWCRREILMAKQMERPLVVVNALSNNEERSFPYLGNVATLRWKMDQIQENLELYDQAIESALDLLLYEVLKDVYLRQYFEDLRQLFDLPETIYWSSRPPELLTLLHLQKTLKQQNIKMLIYPDPPIGMEEMEILSALVPDLEFTTPMFLRR